VHRAKQGHLAVFLVLSEHVLPLDLNNFNLKFIL
jgi:hypothetical protein